ncbi:hypothetical protein [Caulobacter sp. 17J80-11]|uniref:hypothetical protein n=1 Tax=Caulobacter sp. 17J80-11 TaxID=2763502 RepID=UPI001653ECA8|nr:hypothetical protein [Caulobacter sp. 17J80-11]MBC6980517.1 hypothetical protein [Caulobacter sp. 17J80-11]
MKKLFAIAAATALLGATAGSALAADRLADTQMDTVSAGFLNNNQTNVAVVSNLQALEVKNYASKGGEVYSGVKANQNTYISQTNCKFTAFTHC